MVTATRRTERLQDVPLAVQAISAAEIRASGVKDLQDLQFVTPGLVKGDSPSDKGFRIRGIGLLTGSYVSGQENPVGVVIDGVVQGLGPGLSSLADVERVEVLKGPQGTQFGKNAAAGVVNITTARPSLREFFGTAYGSYGTDNEHEARLGVNVPLSETTAMRMSAFFKGYDGFVENTALQRLVGGDRQKGGRIKLLSQITPQLELLFAADGSTQQTDSGSQLWTIRESTVTPPLPGIRYGLGNLKTAEPLNGQHTYTRWGASLELNWRAADYTFTSVSAYRKLEERDWGGIGQGLYSFPVRTVYNDGSWNKSQVTQELRITSPRSAALEYVAGYLYYRQPTASTLTGGLLSPSGGYFAPVPPFTGVNGRPGINFNDGNSVVDTTTTSHALFADGKLRFSPATALLLGVRYTRDKVASSFMRTDYDGGPLGPGFSYKTGNPVSRAAEDGANRATGKIGLEQKVSRDQMVFGTVSTGYLGPIINWAWGTATPDHVKPQTNTNVTLGFKSQWLGRRLTFNGNLFHDRYKNYQNGYFDTATFDFRAENAARMTTRGVEFELGARPTADWALSASMAYTLAQYNEFCSTGTPTVFGLTACVNDRGQAGARLDGQDAPSAPRLTGSLGSTYTARMGDGYALAGTLGYYFRSKTNGTPGAPGTAQPRYGLVNLNVQLTPDEQRWRAGLHVRNLFNKHFTSAVMASPFSPPVGAPPGTPTTTLVNWVNRETERHIGVSLELEF